MLVGCAVLMHVNVRTIFVSFINILREFEIVWNVIVFGRQNPMV